jgi:hypothetical protein
MLARCVKLVFACLALGALPARAADAPRLTVGNRTIERVSVCVRWICIGQPLNEEYT